MHLHLKLKDKKIRENKNAEFRILLPVFFKQSTREHQNECSHTSVTCCHLNFLLELIFLTIGVVLEFFSFIHRFY